MKILDVENKRNIRERINNLNIMIADGNDAAAVLKYASRFRQEIEQELLELLLNPTTDTNTTEAILYYRVADRFCKKLEADAALGKRKEETLTKMKID